MTPSRDQQIRALYRAALERPPSERAGFIAELAGGDEELCNSVELLLSQHGATRPASDITGEPSSASPAFGPGTEIGQYRIEGVLGQGGMGTVYRATDTKLQRSVAIKFLSTHLSDPQATRRFRQEATATSSLNHPHIVTVHDVGEHDGRQYIVSELVDGGTLEDWCAATRRRGWRQSLDLLAGVGDAIAAAHAAGVLHRDIKPGNVLIGSNGYAKLSDFGLAKLLHKDPRPNAHVVRSHDTQAGVVIGTMAYMSPEQAAGQPVDERSDVFSFGVVLYEVLAGRQPFEGSNDLEVLKQILYAAPAALPDDVPELLRIAIERALEKEPSDRYQTMRDFVADLRRVARRSASSQNTRSGFSDARIAAAIVKRHRRVVVATAVAVVAAIVGMTYFLATRVAPPSASTAVAAFAPGDFTITQLTTSGMAVAPAISPDGKYVVYAQGETDATDSLWLRQVGTSSSVQIVPPEAGVFVGAPTITRDGLYVHYVRSSEGWRRSALWRVPLLGGPSTHVLDDIMSPIGWSQDGRQMAYIRTTNRLAESALVVANSDGSGQRELAKRRAPQFFLSLRIVGTLPARPVWSPEANVVAAIDFSAGGHSRMVFVDVTTGTESPSDGDSFLGGAAWLGPNALLLNAARSRTERSQLWRMTYPEGATAPLTNDLMSYIGLDIDHDRDALVTSRRETRASLWVGDATGTVGAEITASYPHIGIGARVAWAGERLLYDTLASGVPAIAAISERGGPSSEIVQNAVFLAPTEDGNTIVYAGAGGGLWRSDGSGRPPVALVTGEFTPNPLLTPDGRHVIFVAIRDGSQTTSVVPIDGGEVTELVRTPVGIGDQTVDIAPDGKLVVLTTNEAAEGIFVVCDWPDCSNRHDVRVPPGGGPPVRWTPDGREIAFVDERSTNIWAIPPLDDATPRQITHFNETTARRRIAHYDWSVDRERLAVVFMTVTEDVVLFGDLQR